MNNKHLCLYGWLFATYSLLFVPVQAAEIFIPGNPDAFPSVQLDPFERQRIKKNTSRQAPRATEPPPASQPSKSNVNANSSSNSPAAPVVTPTTSSKSPAYSYSLFVDVDYVNKLSGGVQTAMSMGEESEESTIDADAAPASSALVYLAHFYGSLDTAKADLWKDGKFVAHIIYGGGESPTGTVGDLRSTSNIDAAFMTPEGEHTMPGLDILELWYEHQFPHNKSSFRVGISYFGSDFYKSKYTGPFITSGIGSIGTEILWNSMASNPPNTSLGVWYKTTLSDNIYWQLAAFDGFPDHSTDVFAFEWDKEEGIFSATEFGWQQGSAKKNGYLKLGLGAWYLKQDMAAVGEKTMYMVGYENYEGEWTQGTGGVYVVADKAIDDNIGVFFKGGIAEDGINKYGRYFTAGAVYKGLIESRPGDVAGIAIVQSKLSNSYLEASGVNEEGNYNLFSHETIYEFTYSAPINKWLMLQPDLQYVLQPRMNPMNLNAWVATLRAEFTIK